MALQILVIMLGALLTQFPIIAGETIIVTGNPTLRAHVRVNCKDTSLNLIKVESNVDDLSYAANNVGDIGIVLKWDSNDCFFFMYSYSNENIYWSFNKGNNVADWNTFK